MTEYTDNEYFTCIDMCVQYIKSPFATVKLMHGWEACIGYDTLSTPVYYVYFRRG